jgi:transcriptional regulator GlxA family with amidase domain
MPHDPILKESSPMKRFTHIFALALAGVSIGVSCSWPDAEAKGGDFKIRTNGEIPVAIVITDGANVIDFSGPWEVFQDTVSGDGAPAFHLYTVSDSRTPVRLTGGLMLVPDYTFDTAPTPAVIVVGAQRGSPAMRQWLRKVSADSQTEALMAVCTGAFKLADAGLLDGKHATTHHDYFDAFARQFPNVVLERGPRYVQSAPHIFTAGGTTSGIDLALHIVSRYYGEGAAKLTARYMEYHPVSQ